MDEKYLIVGLGNPGKEYEKTRHNIGFVIVDALAKGHQMVFEKKRKLYGSISQGSIEEKKVILLQPDTYMNESGKAVKKCKDFFGVALDHLLVVVDDLSIGFGEFRLKDNSGSGGHNGLKSIEEHLHTKNYPRLRFGVGACKGMETKEYVLSPFTQKESEQLPEKVGQAVSMIELWLQKGMATMQQANVRVKRGQSNEEI